jgi:hypothetical protein
MAKKWFWNGMLVTVLAFGMTVVGCGNSTTNKTNTNEADIWTNVTSLSQVNGTWKGSFSDTVSESDYFDGFGIFDDFGISEFDFFNDLGITVEGTIEITITINASAGTMSSSMKATMTFSGSGINEHWLTIKDELEWEGFVINDATKSATITASIPTGSVSLSNFESGIQINQNGTKIKFLVEGEYEVIFVKQ